jgi:DNA processing protein
MESVYQIALTLVPQIGDVQARALVEKLGSAEAVFKCRESLLERIDGIGTSRARAIRGFKDFNIAEKEQVFIHKHGIKAFFFTDKDYPQRLLRCTDAPVLLYYHGKVSLNELKPVGIVGTRLHSEYGKHFTEKLIEELREDGVMIISGLASGIDSIAHRSSLKNDVLTLAVVGHGLDKIYPFQNRELAARMISQSGGILTEFMSGTKPDRHNFPMRNRIVAGLCDALIVVETAVKGGSMITAKLADSYNRDVFALPGKVTDLRSSGCNYLIQHQKAALITCAEDLRQAMGWKPKKLPAAAQALLFPDLSPPEQMVTTLLQNGEGLHIDDLNLRSGLSPSVLASALLNLELNGLVKGLPGKRYTLS